MYYVYKDCAFKFLIDPRGILHLLDLSSLSPTFKPLIKSVNIIANHVATHYGVPVTQSTPVLVYKTDGIVSIYDLKFHEVVTLKDGSLLHEGFYKEMSMRASGF